MSRKPTTNPEPTRLTESTRSTGLALRAYSDHTARPIGNEAERWNALESKMAGSSSQLPGWALWGSCLGLLVVGLVFWTSNRTAPEVADDAPSLAPSLGQTRTTKVAINQAPTRLQAPISELSWDGAIEATVRATHPSDVVVRRDGSHTQLEMSRGRLQVEATSRRDSSTLSVRVADYRFEVLGTTFSVEQIDYPTERVHLIVHEGRVAVIAAGRVISAIQGGGEWWSPLKSESAERLDERPSDTATSEHDSTPNVAVGPDSTGNPKSTINGAESSLREATSRSPDHARLAKPIARPKNPPGSTAFDNTSAAADTAKPSPTLSSKKTPSSKETMSPKKQRQRCRQLAKSNRSEAIACYRPLVSGAGLSAELALYELARISSKPLDRYDEYLARFPAGSLEREVRLNRLQLLYRSGRTTAALAESARIVARFPTFERLAEVQMIRGDLFMSQGNCRSAVRAYQAAEAGGARLRSEASARAAQCGQDSPSRASTPPGDPSK